MNYDRFSGLRFSRRTCEQWRTDANYACAVERFERPFRAEVWAMVIIGVVGLIVIGVTA